MRPLRSLLFIFLGMVVALPAAAYGIVVKPAQIEQKVDPGTQKSFTMTVTNTGEANLTLYPIVRNVTGVNDSNHPVFEPQGDGISHNIAAWLEFDKSPLIVEPKETASVAVVARFPEDATPGSHLAGFFFSDKPYVEGEILGAAVGFDVGAILHFQIAGDAITKASIRYFSTEKTMHGKPPVDFSVGIENQGNTLVRPVGMISIKSMMGKQVADLPINENGAGVFPKTTREWRAQWNPEEIVMGKFTASIALAIEGEDGSDTITRTVSFWILPTHILIPTILGFAAFILVSYIALRLYVRSQLKAVSGGMKGKTRAAEGLSVFASVVIGILLAVIIGFLVLFFYFG